MNAMKRVLICGAPDLNYIDGSSIWAQTIALATANTNVATVDFIAKSTPEREELFGPLRTMPNIEIIDGTDKRFWEGKKFKRLSPQMQANLVQKLDQTNVYDVIIIRGLDIATTLLSHPSVLSKCWLYLTDIPQDLSDYTPELRLTMRRIGSGCRLLLCQTDGFKSLWQALVPQIEEKKYRIYTPVIPDLPLDLTPLAERPLKAVYAGKFKSEWMTLEMAECWSKVKERVPSSELIMIGDKVHDDPNRPNYQKEMRDALEHTAGINWLGAKTREAVQEHLSDSRVGLSWRAESMNDTVEYSTKILEYGGAGCAAILNRNSLHEKLLGSDYPLFANSSQEFVTQLIRALTEPHVAEHAAQALRRLAGKHTFSTRVLEIREWLMTERTEQKRTGKVRILVAGHDLKFFTLLQEQLASTDRFEFTVDEWQGHSKHDAERSHALLETADVIFCEWCLGNLEWYSKHKKPHQRLVARFHAQEMRVPYMANANWEAIDHVSFVSEHTRRQALDTFKGFPSHKTSVIGNLLDTKKFTARRKTGDARYTLGIVGVTPQSKRLDRAIDLLEALVQEDPRYCLRVKGKNPLDYSWLLNRPSELNYYQTLLQRINGNPKIRYNVVFDPPGDDVNDWFTMIGFILSPSDHESFHMAVGEGILTGAVPIIWNWEGASEIWGSEWIVHSIAQAKQVVVESELQQDLAADLIIKTEKHAPDRHWIKLLLES